MKRHKYVFKTETQKGDTTKHIMWLDKTGVFIVKYVLTTDPQEQWHFYEVVKSFKNMKLYKQVIAMKHESFREYVEIYNFLYAKDAHIFNP